MEGRDKLKIALPKLHMNVDNYKNAFGKLGVQLLAVEDFRELKSFDGLLLPGGADIDPARYGQANTGSEGIDSERDEQELFLLDMFVKAGKPVFGICRGQQVINVYFGGTLIQHLTCSERHSQKKGRIDNMHGNRAAPGSFAAKLYGTSFRTNSAHHQAVDILGDGLIPVVWADDGPIEAICHERLPIWSVQWHPERMCFAYRQEDVVDGSLVLKFFLERTRLQSH